MVEHARTDRKTDSEVTRRKSGGNDLVEQIAREQHLNFVQPRSRFFRTEHNRLFEHRAFSAFKEIAPRSTRPV